MDRIITPSLNWYILMEADLKYRYCNLSLSIILLLMML